MPFGTYPTCLTFDLALNDWETSLSYAKRSLNLAQNMDLKNKRNAEVTTRTENRKHGGIILITRIILHTGCLTNLSTQQMADIRNEL
jgi:hypothetical protein